MLKNLARGFLPVLQIRRSPGALTKGFCGSIDRDKDNIGVMDALLDLGRKKKIATSCLLHYFVQTGLIDRQVVTLPGRNTGRVDVNNGHLILGAAGGDHGHGWPADIARPDTQNILGESHSVSFTHKNKGSLH